MTPEEEAGWTKWNPNSFPIPGKEIDVMLFHGDVKIGGQNICRHCSSLHSWNLGHVHDTPLYWRYTSEENKTPKIQSLTENDWFEMYVK